MTKSPALILGAEHTDNRGTLRFFNSFDMTQVKRFYVIENANSEIRRGWRGHKVEKRWFYVGKGSFSIRLVQIDDWNSPDPNLESQEYTLSADDNVVLEVHEGYASSLQALESGSRLIVFGNYELEHAKQDDYLFNEDYFK